MVIVDSFQRLLRDRPDRPLIYLPTTGSIVTTRQLHELTEQVGASIDSYQLAGGSVVGAALGNRPQMIAAFLACAERELPFLPIDVGTTASELMTVGERLQVAALLTAGLAPSDAFPHRHCVCDGVEALTTARQPAAVLNARVLKLTSGSTGVPRATLTSEDALVTDASTLIAAMDITPEAIQVAAIPLSHAYGFGNLLLPLLLQGTAIVMREAFVPQRLPEDAAAVRARLFPGVPFMFEHFVRHLSPNGWPPTLTRLISAGARLEGSLADSFRARFGLKIHSFYGTTETGGICFDDSDDVVAEGTVGRPLPGMQVTLTPHPEATPSSGRVHVRGRAVIGGYVDAADPETFCDAGFLTGDLGRFDSAGRLVLESRVSPFVNIAGRKVQPSEIERVLRDFDGVSDVRVLGFTDPHRGEQLAACLVMRTAAPSQLALRQYCAARLAPYKIPRAFVFLDAMPLTARGKIDRQALEVAVRGLAAGML